MNSKRAQGMSTLVIAAIVMIVILVVAFGVFKGFKVAQGETNDKNEGYEQTIKDCETQPGLCSDIFLENLKNGKNEEGETS